MTNTYNTGNALGSTDPRDLLDNASNLDDGMNSALPTFTDRLGVARDTWAGMENTFDLSQSGREAEFQQFLTDSGFVSLGNYAAGINFTAYNQYMARDGFFYRPAPSSIPFTTTGTWVGGDENLFNLFSADDVLRQDLADATDPAKGTGLVGHSGLLGYPPNTVGRAVNDAALGVVVRSVRQYGAVLDGVTDDGPAIRRALDDMPATGGILDWPEGSQCKIVGTIFIPQRTPTLTVEGWGIGLRGNNSQIIGDGTSTVFESGTGNFSTVSLGGATNFGQPNESVASIHYNSSIRGFNFKNCGKPVRLFNWLHGCTLKELYATNFSTFETFRCFYLSLMDIQGRPLQDARLADTPIFLFRDSNNTMTFNNVHCSGITSGGVPKGTGWEFDAGVQGVVLPGGCSSEGCVTGIKLKSIVYSMAIDGFYLEANSTAIASVGANLLNLTIDNCEFEDNGTDLSVDNWIDGYFGSGNRTENSVTFGNGCTNEVRLPAQTLSDLNHTTWAPLPAGWTVPAGCKVVRNDLIFNSATGFNAGWFRNASDSSGGTGIAPLRFTGECFNVGSVIPYCTVGGVGTGTLTIDTKIVWNPNLSSIRFDLSVIHSSTSTIAGVVSANNTVFRDDATAFTVVPSDNAGFVRLTLGGFGTITSYSGKVRII